MPHEHFSHLIAIWQTGEKTGLSIGRVAAFHLHGWNIETGWFDGSIVVAQEYVCSKYEQKEVSEWASERPSGWSHYLFVFVCRVTGFLIAKTKKLMRSPLCNKHDKPAFNLISNSSLSFVFFSMLCLSCHSTASHERNAMAHFSVAAFKPTY